MGDDNRLHLGPVGAPSARAPETPVEEPAAAPEPAEQAVPRMTKQTSFAEQISLSGRHPVLLFGTAESGKSTLLISLINSMAQNDKHINISLGDRIFSRGDPEAERHYQRAIEFYQRYSKEFAAGSQLPTTNVEKPFFIPIDIRPANGPTARFAFLEGKGDWINPIPGDSGAMFQELKPEIIDLLKHFSAVASVIYVAPFSIGEAITGSTDESDTGLNGAIIKYEESRSLPERDSHLFVLAKWDTFAPPDKNDPLFSHVEGDEVAALLAERFPQSWARFRNLPLRPNSGRRFFMQYAAGHITGGIVRRPPPRYREVFDRYPRSVWNWLYTNAVEALAEGGKGPEQTPPPLFPEALPVKPPRPTIIERILALLSGRK